MKPSPAYFFFLLLLCGIAGLRAQDSGKTLPCPSSAGPSAGPSASLRAGAQGLPTGGSNPGFDETTGKIRTKADSLQSRLDSLKAKAAGRVEKAEAAAGKITRKIDSVQRNDTSF